MSNSPSQEMSSSSNESHTAVKRRRSAAGRSEAAAAAGQPADASAQPATSSQKYSEWKPQDLLKLLNFLKKNGWERDWDVLAEAFPQHSVVFIQDLFRKLGRTVRTQPPSSEETSENPANAAGKRAPIEEWVELLFQSPAHLENISGLPKMLQLIAKYEKHPRPEDCGGVDYAAIYRYLAAVQQGKIPAELNPPTARKVLEMLNCVVDTVRSNTELFKSCVTENVTAARLMKLRKEEGNYDLKTRRREDFNEEEKRDIETMLSGSVQEALQVFIKRPGFNPLAFPATYNATSFQPT